jgi:methionyl-tRNA synthetase
MRPFYVTTPIYYANDRPHIGTAYSTIAADVLSRYHRLRGRPTRLLTGVDEHGQKLERRAKEEGLSPQDFVDRMAEPFREAWQALGCDHDDFIRTTEPRHIERVQAMWRRAAQSGAIYLGEYEGWYCVADEAFYTEKELVDGKAPTGRPVERVKEKSYFFRLSAFADRLLEFYEQNPHFVRPEGRFNEVKSFVRGGLQDISISRTTFRWGIPVPQNREHVMYVWFDALTNYVSALGGPPEKGEHSPNFEKFWAPNADVVHLVGKDILRFHAVYWPAFLMAAGLTPPTQIWAHGWLTVNGEKMSKSSGNFIPPGPLADAFGADVLRYYLMRDIALGQDGDFSHSNLIARYHGDLGNGLGNLLNRIVASIVQKSFGGVVPHVHFDKLEDVDRALIATAKASAENAAKQLEAIAPHKALDAIWELVLATNKYVDQTAPWALAKDLEQQKRLKQVAYTVLESLRFLSIMLWPVMPQKCNDLRAQLGLAPLMPTTDLDLWPDAWGGLSGGTKTAPGAPLFPRFDDDQQRAILERLGVVKAEAPKPAAKPKEKKVSAEASSPAAPATPAAADAPPSEKPLATIDDLSKIELRLGLVLSAERVPKSDKLLKLSVELGEASPRQILAGIGKTYEPEAIVGRRLVVVANLAPRKMMGLESHGMVLAASDESLLSVLSPDKDITPGSLVK